jgi:hypothetical protein
MTSEDVTLFHLSVPFAVAFDKYRAFDKYWDGCPLFFIRGKDQDIE